MVFEKLLRLLPTKHKNESADMQRKWSMLMLLSTVYIIVQTFYLHRYYFFHNLPSSVFVILPMILLNIFSFYYFYKKNFNIAANLILIPVTINLFYMIYMGGGIKAPATYWVAFFPFMYSIFFDKKGMLIGALVTIIALIAYLILDYYIEGPMVASWPRNYKEEKIMNLFTFSIVMMFIYYSFSTVYEEANKKLETQKETIDNLFRVVLHDVTNPLSAIKLRFSLYEKTKNMSDFVKIGTSLNKAICIIEVLRNFKAIEDGSINIPLKNERVDSILSRLRKDVDSLEHIKHIEIVYNDSGISNSDEILCHKESLLVQVLMNILANAIKFSENNSKILISSYSSKHIVVFEIQDFGLGIPQSIIDDLFRFDRATSRPGTCGEQGTGYGMPIAKYFLDSMNAKLKVTSLEKGKESHNHGTIFKITFKKVTNG